MYKKISVVILFMTLSAFNTQSKEGKNAHLAEQKTTTLWLRHNEVIDSLSINLENGITVRFI